MQPDCDADFIPIPSFERLMSHLHVWERLRDASYIPCEVNVALVGGLGAKGVPIVDVTLETP